VFCKTVNAEIVGGNPGPLLHHVALDLANREFEFGGSVFVIVTGWSRAVTTTCPTVRFDPRREDLLKHEYIAIERTWD
jgi:hypothetical protein